MASDDFGGVLVEDVQEIHSPDLSRTFLKPPGLNTEWEDTGFEDRKKRAMEFMSGTQIPEAPRGFGGAFQEGFQAPSKGQAAAAIALTKSDEELKNILLSEFREQEKQSKRYAEQPQTLSEKAGQFIGGLAGSLPQYIAPSVVAGPVGPFVSFGASAGGEEFLKAGTRALGEGKSPEEALSIAKAAAPVGAAIGGTQALILPGGTSTWGQAARESGKQAGAAGAGTTLMNLYERALGLKPPVTEGVLENMATMGALPLAGHALGRILPRIQTPTERITDATKARQVEGGVPGERPGTDAQRTTPEAGPSDSLQRTKEGPAQEKGPARDEVLLDQQIKDLEQDPSATGSMPDVVPVDAQKQAQLQQLRAERDRIVQSKSINIEDPQTKSTIEDVANQLKESGQSGGFKFDHVVEGHPLFKSHGTDVMWTDISDGSVHVNTAMIPKWIKENMLTNAQFRKWFESGLTHEVIHSNLLEALKGKASETMAQYWKDGTWIEQKLTDMAYNRKGERVTDPALLGHEMFRRHAERFAGLTPTEVVQSKGMQWVTQKFIDLLERGIFEARRKFGTKASQRQLEILNKYQKNIDLVRKARGWKSPEEGSLRMQPPTVEDAQMEPIETAKRVSEMGPEEFSKLGKFNRITDTISPSITSRDKVADMIRMSLKASDDLAKTYEAMNAAKAAKNMDAFMEAADKVGVMSTKPQFFNEIVEMATNTGGKEHIFKRDNPSYKPSFPMTDAEVAALRKQLTQEHIANKYQPAETALRMEPKEKSDKKPIAQMSPREVLEAATGEKDPMSVLRQHYDDIRQAIKRGEPVNMEAAQKYEPDVPGVKNMAQWLYEHGYVADQSTGNWILRGGKEWNEKLKQFPIKQFQGSKESLRMEPKKSALEEEPSMGKVSASLNRYRMALKTVFKASPNRKIMDQRFDGADTAANNAGQQARNSIEIGSTPIEREATMAIIEANGDREKLAQFLAQSKRNPKAAAAVRYANANWDRLQPLAERTQKILDSQIKDENNNGISTEFREAYVPHIYDTDLLMGKGMPYVISGKGSGGSTGFKKGRTFDTVFDAIEAGYTPKSIDVGKLVEHRVKVGQRLINRKQWSEGLREIKDPTDNRPLVTDIETHQRPNGTAYQSAPMGYERREIIPGVSIAVHSGYSSLFDALTGTSRISGSAPGRAALATAGGIKHGLLLFDTFHASRIMQKQLFLTGKIGYGKGHSLLEYSDADLGRAVQSNLITPDVASWIKEHRSDANLLVKEGLNVGRIQEALYADMIKSLQEKAAKAAEKIGVPESIANKLQFSKWVFEKVTRGAMMESALIELERISKAKPDVPRAEIARKVARDLNTYFGNLGRQGFFKSRTMQDLMNLSFLAPQWMESMARSEVKGALQMAKGVTIDPVLNRTILLGSLGKGMAGGLLAYLVGTQLLNMATRGHPTWDNPEEKHRLDAWIPDLEGGSKGFFMSPMSVPAELTHDMIRYYNSNPRFLSAVGRIMQNKISPLARASQILFIGKDWDKNMVTDDWDRVKRASIALTPTPLPLSPLVREQSPSGSLQRQLTASAGFKTEPAESGRRTLRPSRPTQKLKRLPSR